MNRPRVKYVVNEILRTIAEDAFTRSQMKCPVLTGYLKSSGRYYNVSNRWFIHYGAQYASFVERGFKGGLQEVRAHYRKGRYVRGHRRMMPPRPASFFIKSSIDEAIRELPVRLGKKLG